MEDRYFAIDDRIEIKQQEFKQFLEKKGGSSPLLLWEKCEEYRLKNSPLEKKESGLFIYS